MRHAWAVQAPTVLCWDIDGTLLTTARAGIYAVEAAVEEVCGGACDLESLYTAGYTDHEVAAAALTAAGIEPDPERTERVLRSYERHLPDCLARRQGRVLPGVGDVLRDLDAEPRVVNVLLTGNTAAGAKAKLGHYGLDGYFVRGGAFCEGPGTREEIARRGLRIAERLANGTGAPSVYVIGDTPRDVVCGVTIGARTVAVASGSYTEDELRACEPWLVLDRIPEPTRFREVLGLAG